MDTVSALLNVSTYKEANTLFEQDADLGQKVVDMLQSDHYRRWRMLRHLPVVYRCLQDKTCNKPFRDMLNQATPLWTVGNFSRNDQKENRPFLHIMNRIKRMEWDAIVQGKPSVLKLVSLFGEVLGVKPPYLQQCMLTSDEFSSSDRSDKKWWHVAKTTMPTSVNILQKQYDVSKNPMLFWKHHLEYIARLQDAKLLDPKSDMVKELGIPSSLYGYDKKETLLVGHALYWNQLRGRSTSLSDKQMILCTYLLLHPNTGIVSERQQDIVNALNAEKAWNRYVGLHNQWQEREAIHNLVMDEDVQRPSRWIDVLAQNKNYALLDTLIIDIEKPLTELDVEGMLDI